MKETLQIIAILFVEAIAGLLLMAAAVGGTLMVFSWFMV